MKPLPRKFYLQDTVTVAEQLLGKILVRQIGDNILSGIISETEAYRNTDDPASHAANKITQRNKAMFGQVGNAYVYFTYGMYHCINAVARSKEFDAGAVLIRAVIPKKGIDIMKKNRQTDKENNLSNGPGKLTQAFDITRNHYGVDLTKKGQLFIAYAKPHEKKILKKPRIGIKKATHLKWNFSFDD